MPRRPNRREIRRARVVACSKQQRENDPFCEVGGAMDVQSLSGTEVSRHKCLIYDGDPSEQLPVVVPLLVDGLNDHWRCLYLGSPEAVGMVSTALSTTGVDTTRETDRGALIFSSDRSHLAGGVFDPQVMVDGLCTAIDTAVSDGFGGLCATGAKRWELGADENFARLLEY